MNTNQHILFAKLNETERQRLIFFGEQAANLQGRRQRAWQQNSQAIFLGILLIECCVLLPYDRTSGIVAISSTGLGFIMIEIIGWKLTNKLVSTLKSYNDYLGSLARKYQTSCPEV